jgi:hypothetical protein
VSAGATPAYSRAEAHKDTTEGNQKQRRFGWIGHGNPGNVMDDHSSNEESCHEEAPPEPVSTLYGPPDNAANSSNAA